MTLQPETLARILLIQNMILQLPSQESIFGFVCRGFEELPGVESVFHITDSEKIPDDEDFVSFPLQLNQQNYGAIVVQVNSMELFLPCRSYIHNLCFMISVILEERRQSLLLKEYQHELEDKVRERTVQLSKEIEERKEAERVAIKAQQQAEYYLEISEAIIVELDRAGRVRVVNKRGCQILGYSREEIIGRDWFSLCLPAESCAKVHQVFERAMKDGGQFEEYFENEIFTSSGGIRHIAWHNRRQYDRKGNIVGVLSSGIDVTHRKEYEEALRKEKELLAVTLRSIGDGVIATDIDQNIVLMNPVAVDMTGRSPGIVLERPLEEILHLVERTTRQSLGNPAAKVLETGEAVELTDDCLLISADGRELIITAMISPILDSGGNLRGTVLVLKDVTAEANARENLQRANRLEALGVLAGGIAHDFNNLLSGIFGNIEMARQRYDKSDPKVSHHLELAVDAFDRARDLTDQLLTFAKGGAPKTETDQLADLIRKNCLFALTGSQVRSCFDIANDLWLCDFDKNQIGQVINNMVLNAQQAMPKGGEILIAAENVRIDPSSGLQLSPGRYVKMTIKDTGEGIPGEHLGRIFDPFFTTKAKGNGLGLATCFSIIKRHHGTIEVDSACGKGTRFDIFLPASEKQPSDKVQVKRSVHSGSGLVIVLDDEPVIRDLLDSMLREMNYQVIVAAEGDEVISLCQEQEAKGTIPVAMILDLTIPGAKGGADIIGWIRNRYPGLPVFASSGYSESPVMASPEEYGFSGRLIKPYQYADLEKLLDLHLA